MTNNFKNCIHCNYPQVPVDRVTSVCNDCLNRYQVSQGKETRYPANEAVEAVEARAERKHGEYYIEGEKLFQWNDIFERGEEFNAAEYLENNIDFAYYLNRLDQQEPQESEEEKGIFYKALYVCSCFTLYPSGKFYMPWSTNVSEAEARADEETREYLEKLLSENNAWMGSGEGSGEDVFFFKSWELPDKIKDILNDDNELPAHSGYGGYPIYYITDSGETFCAKCANEYKHCITDYGANYENPHMYCECSERIPSAYAEDSDNCSDCGSLEDKEDLQEKFDYINGVNMLLCKACIKTN